MDAPPTAPIIVSNWLAMFFSTIIMGLGAAVTYVLHSKADRNELKAIHEALKEIRTDIREVRSVIMPAHVGD